MTSLAKDDGLVGSGMWSKVLTFIGSSLVGCGKCTLDYIPTECFALVHHGLAGSSFQPNLHHALVTFHYIGIWDYVLGLFHFFYIFKIMKNQLKIFMKQRKTFYSGCGQIIDIFHDFFSFRFFWNGLKLEGIC